MSINYYFSSSPDIIPQSLWWTKQQPPPPPVMENHHSPTSAASSHKPFTFNLNEEDDVEELQIDDQFTDHDREDKPGEEGHDDEQREPMFEKPLTPSDVGKLNRLVIPKSHAEKYFPLSPDSSERGLLLTFEDEAGKSWRFRYSYWNSSQSYVLTKGWSRFVKEKRLDAGDVVSFCRHRGGGDRFFIGWRRRSISDAAPVGRNAAPTPAHSGSSGWTRLLYSTESYPSHHHQHKPHCLHAGGGVENQTVSSVKYSKRVRLFGVNLECLEPDADESEPSTPDGSTIWSHGQVPYCQCCTTAPNPDQTHMDINFTRDVNRYHQG